MKNTLSAGKNKIRNGLKCIEKVRGKEMSLLCDLPLSQKSRVERPLLRPLAIAGGAVGLLDPRCIPGENMKTIACEKTGG